MAAAVSGELTSPFSHASYASATASAGTPMSATQGASGGGRQRSVAYTHMRRWPGFAGGGGRSAAVVVARLQRARIEACPQQSIETSATNKAPFWAWHVRRRNIKRQPSAATSCCGAQPAGQTAGQPPRAATTAGSRTAVAQLRSTPMLQLVGLSPAELLRGTPKQLRPAATPSHGIL